MTFEKSISNLQFEKSRLALASNIISRFGLLIESFFRLLQVGQPEQFFLREAVVNWVKDFTVTL